MNYSNNEEIHSLIKVFYKYLKLACEGKVSSEEISEERLWWEIYNKIFSILVIIENAIRSKDSLSIQLIARYAYELLIVSVFIFTNKNKTDQIKKFLEFNQFKNKEQKWINKTYAEMVKDFSESYKIEHKEIYKKLSNFAHPTIDSFLINRRGDESEFIMIKSTSLLTLFALTEIVILSFKESKYLDDKHQNLLNIKTIRENISNLQNSF